MRLGFHPNALQFGFGTVRNDLGRGVGKGFQVVQLPQERVDAEILEGKSISSASVTHDEFFRTEACCSWA